MERAELIERLVLLPGEIACQERMLLVEDGERADAVRELQEREDALLLDAERINGKNAEARAAQLRAATERERRIADELTRRVAKRKVALHELQNRLAALKAVARLVAAGEE